MSEFKKLMIELTMAVCTIAILFGYKAYTDSTPHYLAGMCYSRTEKGTESFEKDQISIVLITNIGKQKYGFRFWSDYYGFSRSNNTPVQTYNFNILERLFPDQTECPKFSKVDKESK